MVSLLLLSVPHATFNLCISSCSMAPKAEQLIYLLSPHTAVLTAGAIDSASPDPDSHFSLPSGYLEVKALKAEGEKKIVCGVEKFCFTNAIAFDLFIL